MKDVACLIQIHIFFRFKLNHFKQIRRGSESKNSILKFKKS